MMKIKRKKIYREHLENQLAKYERRIQKLAEGAYHIRQAIELLDAQEAARNQEKGEISNAIHNAAVEGLPSGGETDSNAGELDVLDPTITEAILDK